MALIFQNYVRSNRSAFVNKVIKISKALRINPNWLMALMFHESRLNHQIRNNMGCVGLIQFCPSGGLSKFGLTASQMANMSNVKQLDYVYSYFKSKAGQYKSYFDLHLYAFYPVAFNYKNRSSWIFGSEQSMSYARTVKNWNPPFDWDRNGYISITDFRNYLNHWLKKNRANFNAGSSNGLDNKKILILAFLGYFAFSDDDLF